MTTSESTSSDLDLTGCSLLEQLDEQTVVFGRGSGPESERILISAEVVAKVPEVSLTE